jgi:hypothetical protein
MAQKQVDYEKHLQNLLIKSKYTQTGDDDKLFIHLENKKTARIYYSTAYKENVLSLNFGSSKSFLFTKSMWKVFRNYTKSIDSILLDE